MKTVKIGIIGFGNVAQGLVQALKQKHTFLRDEHGITPLITAVTDVSFGAIANPEGLDLNLLEKASQDFSEFKEEERTDWDAFEMIQNSDTDVILELSVANLETGDPAAEYITQALNAGKHVITSNKGPIALKYRVLNSLAQKNGVKLGIETTVMSGTPVIAYGTGLLRSAGITGIRGIFNGTCNFILSEMRKGLSFENALALAQKLGYAESNPANDIEGYDTAAKLSILSEVFFGERIPPLEIPTSGITVLSSEDIAAATAQNSAWKLVGSIELTDDRPIYSVKPVLIPMGDPLSSTNGSLNSIQFETELLGSVTVTGPGSGRIETAAGLIQDLIYIFREDLP